MTTTKILITAMLGSALSASVVAQGAPPQQGGDASGVPSDAVFLDPTLFIQEVDTNKDGKLSKQEWVAAGLVENVFSRFDKNNDGALSKEEVAGMYHPPTLDSNKDGKLTLAEMKAHMAKQASEQAQQGAAPPK